MTPENELSVALDGVNLAVRAYIDLLDANPENENRGDMQVNPQRVPATGDLRARFTAIIIELREAHNGENIS